MAHGLLGGAVGAGIVSLRCGPPDAVVQAEGVQGLGQELLSLIAVQSVHIPVAWETEGADGPSPLELGQPCV